MKGFDFTHIRQEAFGRFCAEKLTDLCFMQVRFIAEKQRIKFLFNEQ